MDLNLICSALEVIERDYHIPNPLKGRVSIIGDRADGREISRYYPKPQQEEMYYFISGFLKEGFNVPRLIRLKSLFNNDAENKVRAFQKVYKMGLNARRDYDARS